MGRKAKEIKKNWAGLNLAVTNIQFFPPKFKTLGQMQISIFFRTKFLCLTYYGYYC